MKYEINHHNNNTNEVLPVAKVKALGDAIIIKKALQLANTVTNTDYKIKEL